ncbi:MAG: MopE-related protein [Patescibacteria group bacterium]
MKKISFKTFFVLGLLGLSLTFIYLNYPKIINKLALAQSKDAIAIRVIPNPNHISAQRWYKEQGFSGSPQAIIVDGYEGIRDGRTVYVNAANVDLNVTPKKFYTNIYLISYNQQAEKSTVDIFGQIVNHWQFNTNLAKGKDNNDDDAKCSADSELKCITDKDCAGHGYCSSYKAQVTRDTIRLARLNDIDTKIKQYGQTHSSYPQLSAGTYLPNITISTWPSWQDNFAKELGGSLPVDPINKFSVCDGYNAVTCWNEADKKFAWTITAEGNTIEAGSRVFLYQANSANTYKLCAFAETPFITDSCNSECIPMCFDRVCGPSGCKDAEGKDILCGSCSAGDCSSEGYCYTNCPSSGGIYAGCQNLNKLDNAYVIPGKCDIGKCFKCNPGYKYEKVLENGVEVWKCVSHCTDNDGDGYGNPASADCNFPDLDCNDFSRDINPGAKEICDGQDKNDIDKDENTDEYIDNNCNNIADENCDGDSDTYCDCNQTIVIGSTLTGTCSGTNTTNAGLINNTCDCNDDNNKVYPNRSEICTNNVDDNCDKLIDCNDPTCSGEPVCKGRCDDGTPVNKCSTNLPLYCNAERKLVEKCSGGEGNPDKCGCPTGYLCSEAGTYCEPKPTGFSVSITNPNGNSASISQGGLLYLSALASGGISPYTYTWTIYDICHFDVDLNEEICTEEVENIPLGNSSSITVY